MSVTWPDCRRTGTRLAAVCVFLGMAVLAGWLVDNRLLMQVVPGFVPMQFNTALGFLLAGLGTVAVLHHRRGAALACALPLLLLASLTLVQYVTGHNYGLDELFWRAQIDTETSHPGRMAPNTALCFILCALAVLSLSTRLRLHGSVTLAGFLAVSALALALCALIGYLGGAEAAYGWMQWTQMAVHTAAGFVLVSLALLCAVRVQIGPRLRPVEPLFPALVAYSMTVLVVNLWLTHRITVREALEEHTEAQLALMRNVLESRIAFTTDALERLGSHWSDVPLPHETLPEDLRRHLADMPALDAIAVFDRNDVLLAAEARSPAHRESLLARAQENLATFPHHSLLQPVERGADAHLQALFYSTPEYPHNRAHVHVLALLNISHLLDAASGEMPNDFHLHIREGEQTLFSTHEPERAHSPADETTLAFHLVNRTWEVGVVPTSELKHAYGLDLPWLTLFGGFLGTGLVFGLIRQSQHLRERVANAMELTLRLCEEASERERAEEALHERNIALERSNRELEEFAQVASHDLQEPLRKIRAFAGKQREKAAPQLDAQSLDYLERMNRGAERMSRLIESLLSYARVTTRARPLEPVALEEVLADVREDLQGLLDKSGGHIEVESPLPRLRGDPTQLCQLFQNLVGNALKFAREGAPSVVTIRTHGEAPGGMATVEVQDNGIGFAPEEATRIFGIFERLHGNHVYEGTGIGLAVCKKIVERHGGTIEAEGRQGEGATFRLQLPLASGQQRPLPSPTTEKVHS